MKLTHSDLSMLGALAGYENLLPGLCAGFSGMWMQAVLAEDEATFYNRLAFMAQYKNKLPQLVQEIHNARAKKNRNLTENDKQLLDILAFFDGIQLYLYPDKHPGYFPDNYVSQKDILSIFDVTHPSRLNSSTPEILLDKNYSFTKTTLINFLNDLALNLDKSKAPAPILLSSGRHSVCLKYDAQESCWHYVDTNDYAIYTEDDIWFRKLDTPDLADSIFASFETSQYAVFNTCLVTNEPNEALKNKLHQVDKNYPLNTTMANNYDAQGTSIFYLACRWGGTDNVQELLKPEYNTDVNREANDATPFDQACQNGHNGIVKELLKPEYNTDINWATVAGVTAFYRACEKGHIEIVKELLKPEYKTDINRVRNDGVTHFFLACRNGHIEIVKELLKPEYNTDIHRAPDIGVTPFYMACKNGHIEIFKELLKPEYNIDINQPTNNGLTPIIIACINGHYEIFKELLKWGYNTDTDYGYTLFFNACQNGHVEVVRELLKPEYKIDIHRAADNGQTPFFCACIEGYTEIVKEFLKPEYKTDINWARGDGATSFHAACQIGHIEIVKEFLKPEYNTDVNWVANQGLTPFISACLCGRSEIVKVLLESGRIADINQAADYGITPFYIACSGNHVEVVKELLKPAYNTDINRAADDGRTPFFTACEQGFTDIIKIILASPNFITFHTEQYPQGNFLHIACLSSDTQDNKELFQLLLENNASLTEKNADNQTPFDAAFDNNNQAAIEVILEQAGIKNYLLQELMSSETFEKLKKVQPDTELKLSANTPFSFFNKVSTDDFTSMENLPATKAGQISG